MRKTPETKRQKTEEKETSLTNQPKWGILSGMSRGVTSHSVSQVRGIPDLTILTSSVVHK
jgi:hypothetical protein